MIGRRAPPADGGGGAPGGVPPLVPPPPPGDSADVPAKGLITNELSATVPDYSGELAVTPTTQEIVSNFSRPGDEVKSPPVWRCGENAKCALRCGGALGCANEIRVLQKKERSSL